MVRRRKGIHVQIASQVILFYKFIAKYLHQYYNFFFSSIPDNKEFHGPSVGRDMPFLYCVLGNSDERPLSCPPAMRLVMTSKAGKTQKYLLRGDSEGYVNMWAVPEISMDEIKVIFAQQAETRGAFN